MKLILGLSVLSIAVLGAGCASTVNCDPSCCADCPAEVVYVEGAPREITLRTPNIVIPEPVERPADLTGEGDDAAWIRAALVYITALEHLSHTAVLELLSVKSALGAITPPAPVEPPD